MNTVSIGKSQDGRWAVEVAVQCNDFSKLVTASKAYNSVAGDACRNILVSCLANGDFPDRLFFVLEEHPEPLFGKSGLTSESCFELASALVVLSGSLNGVGLGLWQVRPQLCFRLGGRLKVIPSFWIPFLTESALLTEKGLAPEIEGSATLGPFSPPCDIFAIASICYEGLADAPPKLPYPKLPGEWNAVLGSWDPALDAGLRVKPERRPSTPSSWRALLPDLQPMNPQPNIRGFDPSSTATGSSSKRISRPSILVLGMGVVIALLVWFFRGSIPVTPAEIRSLVAPTYQRGFGNSIIQYADKSYVGSKWKEMYNVNKLRPKDVRLKECSGWDKGNLIAFGEADYPGEGSKPVLLHLRDGRWTLSRVGADDMHVQQVAFVSASAFYVLSGSQSRFLKLVKSTGAEFEQVFHWEGSFSYPTLHVTSRDTFQGERWPDGFWEYNGREPENQRDDDVRRKYVRTHDNRVAQASWTYTGNKAWDMSRGAVRSMTAHKEGYSLGVYSPRAGDVKSCIVSYENGVWYQEFEIPQEKVENAWFLNKTNLVGIGRTKIVKVEDGKISFQTLLVGETEARVANLTRVWGHSMSKYWVADRVGNIFGFADGKWTLLVRGPVQKDPDSDAAFKVHWVSPEGAVFGCSKEAVYCLE